MVPFNHPIPPNRPRIEGRRYTGYLDIITYAKEHKNVSAHEK
jgi:hypothetical protein